MEEGLSWHPLAPGEFPRLIYGFWRQLATGVLTVSEGASGPLLLVLRRGDLIVSSTDALGRKATQTLETICSWRRARYHFDADVAWYPPGMAVRKFALGQWVRRHYESQVDQSMAEVLTRELAGARIHVRPGQAPPRAVCDETDRRILSALSEPRRLDQVWPLARCPRFRLLAFIYFMRRTGALDVSGVAAPARDVSDPVVESALRTLGVDGNETSAGLKRAYRQHVRALHPDLHPDAEEAERRRLEQALAEVNRAYHLLSARL